MTLIKFGHACVRLESGDAAVVIDPGVWTDPAAVAEATAVLVTHEHPDHWTIEHLAASDAAIWTIGAVADLIAQAAPEVAERVHRVAPGDRFEVGEVAVEVVGEKHAVIHPDLPHFDNSGYLLTAGGRTLFHPGDALTVPPTTPDLLCLPVSAPWLKSSECVDFARAVGAESALAIHDEVYSDRGLGIIDGHIGRLVETDYRRVAPGTEVAGW